MAITVSYTKCSSLSNSVIQNKIDYINRIASLLDDTIAKVKTDYQTHFNSLLTNIIKIYKASNKLTSSIIIAYNLAVGEESDFFTMFNCHFLSHELIQFVNLFHNKVAKACRDIGISSLIGAFFSYIAIYTLLRAMYHYEEDKEDKVSKEETNVIEPEQVRISSNKE